MQSVHDLCNSVVHRLHDVCKYFTLTAMTDLRSRQKALARRAILEALADLIAETRHLDFSVQEVAARAGVSLRTVYNHFPSREDLLDGLNSHFNEVMVEREGVLIGDVDSVEQLVEAAAANFRIFEDLGGLSEAWVQVGALVPPAAEEHEHRTARMVELVADALPDLDPAQQRVVGTLVRHLFGQHTWYLMTRDYGLSIDDTVEAARWAVAALLDAARGGDPPHTEGATS